MNRQCKNCIHTEDFHLTGACGGCEGCKQFIPKPPPWDTTFMDLARVMAYRSKDRSSAIGAVIVDPHTRAPISLAYNGMPREVNDMVETRHIRPLKYLWFEHAERNAVFNAARLGHNTSGSMIYVCGLSPCSRCARAIIQAGIIEVVIESWYVPERWKEDMDTAHHMLHEAQIKVRCIDGSENPDG